VSPEKEGRREEGEEARQSPSVRAVGSPSDRAAASRRSRQWTIDPDTDTFTEAGDKVASCAAARLPAVEPV